MQALMLPLIDPKAASTPVARACLFRGAALRIHDNVCRRTDPAVSPETAPLEFFEVVLPRAGVWIRHRAGEALVVDAYHAHLFARGEVHRVSHPGGCGDRNTGIVLTDELAAELDPRALERGAFAVPAVALDERTYAAHCALIDDVYQGGIDALEIEERALGLAGAAIRATRKPERAPSPPRAHRELAREAQSILARRFRERMGLDELAASLGVSVFHLCRVFRSHFGTSMHAYRRSLRVRAALRLLADPGLSTYDVAERAGFSDRTQLTRAMSSLLGKPPGAFRRGARTATR